MFFLSTRPTGLPHRIVHARGDTTGAAIQEALTHAILEKDEVAVFENSFVVELLEDADAEGKTLCRPAGYFTHDLNRAGRRWLDEDKITLVQPQTPADCFRMVAEGKVDAAAVNLFLGASTIVKEGLRDTVVPLEKPLSEEGLHVVISKRHWRGTTHLYRINAGLQKLRGSGRFEEIMSRHLELFWAQLQ